MGAAKQGAGPQAKGRGATTSSAPIATQTEAAAVAPTTQGAALTSYDIFELCVQRARNLVKLHEAAHGKPGKPEPYTSDAHRAAIVLAVSALDAFIRDLILARTRTLLANKTTALPQPLSDHIRKFIKDEELLEAARKDDLMERVEKAFRADFDRRSFQGTKNIEEILRIVGYVDIFHEVAAKASVNEDSLRSDLNRFTQRRHAIAHRGDYDLSKNPPQENLIKKKDAEDCIRLVCRVARVMHDLGMQK